MIWSIVNCLSVDRIAIAYDHSNAYSPDLATAQFLRPLVREGATIALTYLDEPEGNQAYDAVGVLPHFDHNIFMNQQTSFWSWSASNPTEDMFAAALRSRPLIVLAEIRQPHRPQPIILLHPKVEVLAKAGYALTHVFCGARPERLKFGQESCHLIFTLVASQQRPSIRSVERTVRDVPRVTPGAVR